MSDQQQTIDAFEAADPREKATGESGDSRTSTDAEHSNGSPTNSPPSEAEMDDHSDSGADDKPTHSRAAEAAAVADQDSHGDISVVNSDDGEGSADVPSPRDCDWMPYFPFDQPYDQQITAINTFLDILSDNGWYAVEGPCGTGKTLIALTSAIHAIRNSSYTVEDETTMLPGYERVVAVTRVKQQLKQFIAEVRAINRNLPADEQPVHGIVLRGMADMLAYSRADNLDFQDELERKLLAAADDDTTAAELGPFNDRVSAIRSASRELIKEGSSVDLVWDVAEPSTCSVDDCRKLVATATEHRCPFHQNADDDSEGPWYDPVRADRVAEIVEGLGGERLRVNGEETPYPAELPTVRDVMPFVDSESAAVDPDQPFDPFYAQTKAASAHVRFSDGEDHVLDGESLVRVAAKQGCCPHATMSDLAETATVVIGNYNHLFDPETRNLTQGKAGLLDENTITVVDEAHRVEEQVRSLLSDEASIYALRRTYLDIKKAIDIYNGVTGPDVNPQASHEARETARTILREVDPTSEFSADDLEKAAEFMKWAMNQLEEMVFNHLQDEYRDWPLAIGDGKPEQDSFGLHEPGVESDTDTFTGRIERSRNYDKQFVSKLATLCHAVGAIHEEVNVSDRDTIAESTGRLFTRWITESNIDYYREIVIEHSPHDNPGSSLPEWAEKLTARFHLYNCIPDSAIGQVYNELGGGIVMSATLEPLDTYREAAGLAHLEEGIDEPTGEGPEDDIGEGSRRVESETYELQFPEENRASWIVPLNRFTFRNRGETVTDRDAMSRTRRNYADMIQTIGASHGNILIGMPNYREAEWAADLLEDVPKSVYLDQSTSDAETTELLDSFFTDDHAILITSSLGTVTEGIDYDGDKLHCAAVIGVPFRNTQSDRAQAVIEAYDQKLATGNSSGFDMAIAVPAVRKARQAIGRVIRGPDEHGIRIFVDERYAQTGKYNVGQYLADQERQEFQTVGSDMLDFAFGQFWEDRVEDY